MCSSLGLKSGWVVHWMHVWSLGLGDWWSHRSSHIYSYSYSGQPSRFLCNFALYHSLPLGIWRSLARLEEKPCRTFPEVWWTCPGNGAGNARQRQQMTHLEARQLTILIWFCRCWAQGFLATMNLHALKPQLGGTYIEGFPRLQTVWIGVQSLDHRSAESRNISDRREHEMENRLSAVVDFNVFSPVFHHNTIPMIVLLFFSGHIPFLRCLSPVYLEKTFVPRTLRHVI